MSGLDVTVGLNQLTGRARQDSQSYSYSVPLDGSAPQTLAKGTAGDGISLRDRRSFLGAYAQSRLTLSKNASLLAGLRWNHTDETRRAEEDGDRGSSGSQRTSRLSGSLGGQWRIWQDPRFALDDLVLHASVGSTFQPPQIDFGPEAGFDPLLKPETQRSVTIGAKADALDGRVDVDISGFFVDFDNQAVTSQVDGAPVLRNGGKQRFKGAQLEATWRMTPAWSLSGHASVSDARYRDFDTVIDGAQTQLSGKRLALDARFRTGAGIIYAPERGLRGSLTTTYTGPRYLDSLNTVRVNGYSVVDASLGYRFTRLAVSLAAGNLTNRRDATVRSELGESQFYRMSARRFDASLSMTLQ